MVASVFSKENPAREHGRRKSDVGLETYGITQASNVYWNLTAPELYEQALRRGEGAPKAE